MTGNNEDGVTLLAMNHPIAPWWSSLWLWLFHRDLDPDSLEQIEIEIPDRQK